MEWFKATRSTGEKNQPGEFTVEDSDGAEWQVTAIESKKKPGTLSLLNEVVCMNKGYECGWEMRGDIHQAVKDLLEVEASEDPEKRRERFLADLAAVCKKHRVMIEPDGSEWGCLSVEDIRFQEFSESGCLTFYVSLDSFEEAIRQAVWPVVHPE